MTVACDPFIHVSGHLCVTSVLSADWLTDVSGCVQVSVVQWGPFYLKPHFAAAVVRFKPEGKGILVHF